MNTNFNFPVNRLPVPANTNITNTGLPALLPTATPKIKTPNQIPIPNQKQVNIVPIQTKNQVNIVPIEKNRVILPNPNIANLPPPTESDKFDTWCASLPVPTVENTDEHAWLIQYQQYLYRLLETIIPNEEVRKIYVSEENMGTWVQALTHETFNPNPDKNYEVYETIGDALAKSAFIKYLYGWNPQITPAQITSFSSNYLGKGKDFQCLISEKLKLINWLLEVLNFEF